MGTICTTNDAIPQPPKQYWCTTCEQYWVSNDNCNPLRNCNECQRIGLERSHTPYKILQIAQHQKKLLAHNANGSNIYSIHLIPRCHILSDMADVTERCDQLCEKSIRKYKRDAPHLDKVINVARAKRKLRQYADSL